MNKQLQAQLRMMTQKVGSIGKEADWRALQEILKQVEHEETADKSQEHLMQAVQKL
jgi:uncharacterized coiled-coil protein SlyX